MQKAPERTFVFLKEGDKESFEIELTDRLIASFAELSGDYNPLHLDAAYAEQTEFKKPVAHGMIIGALFSRLVGMHLPGAYALYLSQSLAFRQPAFAGTKILIEGSIVQKIEALKIVKITTVAYALPSKEILADGEALVKLLK